MSVRTKSFDISPYRSRFEWEFANQMGDWGITFKYESERVPYLYPIQRGTCLSCGAKDVGRNAHYTPDFWLPAHKLWVEAKGKWTGAGRTKTLAVLNSENKINLSNFRIVFMYDNWTTKRHKQKYSNWCDTQGILYSVGIDDFISTLEK